MAILKDADTGRLIEVDSTLPFEHFKMISNITVPPTLYFNLPPSFRPLQEGEDVQDRFAKIPSCDWEILNMAVKLRADAREVEPRSAANGSETR